MHLLIAPNAFKNSLSATAAAEAIRRGVERSGLRCTTNCFPIGDGGDGTALLLVNFFNGFIYETEAHDPIGRRIRTSIGFIDGGKTAVIEMADISGLKLLDVRELDPLYANSFGCGELLKTALDRGVDKILLAIGGSATTDGGTGILQALGVRFLDSSGNELENLPIDLVMLDKLDLTGIDKRIWNTELIILCDVENQLLGGKGAAAIFSPQKGAGPAEVPRLEKILQKLRDVSLLHTGIDMGTLKHGGAAGGTAAGLHLFLKAKLMAGADYFLELTRFKEALRPADFLITGEGRIDLQTLDGKAPIAAARLAKEKGIPVFGLAGQVSMEMNSTVMNFFDVVLPIGRMPEGIKEALLHTAANLEETAFQIGRILQLNIKQEEQNE